MASVGDPRRPYPIDMEMKAGVLGRLSAGVHLPSKDSDNALGPAHLHSNIPTSIVGMSTMSANQAIVFLYCC